VKTNRALLISIFVNLALIGWIISLRLAHTRQMTSSAATNATTKTRPSAEESKTAHDFPAQFVAARQANPFDWRQVESRDYKQYIANLRAVGCPEETIRDIITADVNKLFEERRKSLAGEKTRRFEYWKPKNLANASKKRSTVCPPNIGCCCCWWRAAF